LEKNSPARAADSAGSIFLVETNKNAANCSTAPGAPTKRLRSKKQKTTAKKQENRAKGRKKYQGNVLGPGGTLRKL